MDLLRSPGAEEAFKKWGGETITTANPTKTSNVKARQKQGVMRAEHETCHPHNKSSPPPPRGDSVKTKGLTERQPERQTRELTKPTANQPNKNTQIQTNKLAKDNTRGQTTREQARMRNTVATNVWEASKGRPRPECEPDKFVEETRKEHRRNVLQWLNTPWTRPKPLISGRSLGLPVDNQTQKLQDRPPPNPKRSRPTKC